MKIRINYSIIMMHCRTEGLGVHSPVCTLGVQLIPFVSGVKSIALGGLHLSLLFDTDILSVEIASTCCYCWL